MKVLAVKQPWASLIAEGIKTIEVRSKPTNVRERVAIYASRTLPSGELIRFRDLARGCIIATVDFVGCREYQSFPDFVQDEPNHRIPCANSTDIGPFGRYGWELSNVKKLDTPIPFKMPRGCVVWANYEGKL